MPGLESVGADSPSFPQNQLTHEPLSAEELENLRAKALNHEPEGVVEALVIAYQEETKRIARLQEKLAAEYSRETEMALAFEMSERRRSISLLLAMAEPITETVN